MKWPIVWTAIEEPNEYSLAWNIVCRPDAQVYASASTSTVMYGMTRRYAAFRRSLCVRAVTPKYTEPAIIITVILKYFTTSLGMPMMVKMNRSTPIPAIAIMNPFMALLIRVLFNRFF